MDGKICFGFCVCAFLLGCTIGLAIEQSFGRWAYLTATTTDQKVVILGKYKVYDQCLEELGKRLEFGPPEKAILQCSKEK